MKLCSKSAIYVIMWKKGKTQKAEHTFACGTHVGLQVRSSVESAHKCRVKVGYCPEPGDQPCLFGEGS